MKKKIGVKVYDTETASVVATNVHGNWGDTDGYEEILYCTTDGCHFVWGRGGSDSPYPQEAIHRVAKSDVSDFMGKCQ